MLHPDRRRPAVTGFVIFARKKDVIVLDMTLEDGAKMVISAGLVTPEYRADRRAAGRAGTVEEVEAPGARRRAVQPARSSRIASSRPKR